MNWLKALRLDWKRWRNRRARQKRFVAALPAPDKRDWSGAYMEELKAWRKS